MTVTAANLRTSLNEAIRYGDKCRVRYYSRTFNTGSYDDDFAITRSGTELWVSGLLMPIDSNRGSIDAILVEQGRLLLNDVKLFVEGSLDTSGIIKIGLGSPTPNEEYSMVPEGINAYNLLGSIIYKKVYLRVLQGGSFIGE